MMQAISATSWGVSPPGMYSSLGRRMPTQKSQPTSARMAAEDLHQEPHPVRE